MADVGPGELDGEFEVGLDVGVDEEPGEGAELPLAPVVVPFEVTEGSETAESIALEPAPLALPHPQPQRATVTSTKKSRKNGESCGRK
jgi:hypothetical protein